MVKPCLRSLGLLGREPIYLNCLLLIYFHSFSSRASSNILSFIIRRSHTSILSWSLSILFTDRSNRRDVKVLLVDDLGLG